MDQPGSYQVIHNNLVVTARELRSSPIVARLAKDVLVEVLEVVIQEEGKKQVRGKIESPAGWITLLDRSRNLRGAAPVSSADPQPATGSPCSGPIEAGSGSAGSASERPSAAVAVAVSPPPTLGVLPAPCAASEKAAPGTERIPVLQGPAVPAAAAIPAAAPASTAPSSASSAILAATTSASTLPSSSAAQGHQRIAERLRRLEGEALELATATEQLEAELATTQADSAELQARWADISGISDDVLQEASEARRKASLLRRAIQGKEKIVAEKEKENQEVGEEGRRNAKAELASLEAAFNERLKLEVRQKEMQLQEEKLSLWKASEALEKRLNALNAEKACVEQRTMAAGTARSRSLGGHEAMLEAHLAIVQAFGEAAGSACCRSLDEPTLKVAALLFKQPMFRRVFFAFSATMWAWCVLRFSTMQQNAPPVHF